MPKRSGPPVEFSFESAYELILRKRRRKAEGLPVDQGGRPRKVLTVADVFEAMRPLTPFEVTAQSRNPTKVHRGKAGLWKRRYGG